MRRQSSHYRKGFVLVSVLMLGVLLISCATTFTWFVRRQVRTVGGEIGRLSARSLAHVIVSSVISLTGELSSHTNCDSPTQRWYQPFVFSVPDVGIWMIQVTPLDDKIPLRNLFLPDGNTMRRELTEVWREMWTRLKHRELEMITLDFLDKNNRPRVASNERDNFINREPYDISEMLVLSPDMNADILYGSDGEMGLADYCTVYTDGKINLNVAPVHVMELIPGLDTGGLAASIAEYRTENAIASLGDLRKIPGASARTSNQVMNIAGFKSRYFSIRLEGMSIEDDNTVSFRVIYDRNTKQIVKWEEI
ncbi:MAG: general secretion pathway protein GspK [Synergistaceae bacterium]|nr:general secretion pathway protein GspK [Synergistaceae bacterium]